MSPSSVISISIYSQSRHIAKLPVSGTAYYFDTSNFLYFRICLKIMNSAYVQMRKFITTLIITIVIAISPSRLILCGPKLVEPGES